MPRDNEASTKDGNRSSATQTKINKMKTLCPHRFRVALKHADVMERVFELEIGNIKMGETIRKHYR